MIIESAFYNLPEIILSEESNSLGEYSIRNMFSSSVLLEFNSRNVPYPLQNIKLEERYPYNKKLKCDLVVFLGDIANKSLNKHFGFCKTNWIEIKYFGSFSRKAKGSESVTENIGKILDDILRLCLLIDEPQGNIKENGRYLICIFDQNPETYLSKYVKTEWLKEIFKQNMKNIEIKFSDLKHSSLKGIKSFNIDNKNLQVNLKLDIDTKAFYPLIPMNHRSFYGYLIKIITYSIKVNDLELTYSDFLNERWSEGCIVKQKQILEMLLKRGNINTIKQNRVNLI